MEPLSRPSDMGPDLPRFVEDEVIDAAYTFPVETGLGWDRMHPRVVSRISTPLLTLLVQILIRCEADGGWPKAVSLVLIALLRKNDGGSGQ